MNCLRAASFFLVLCGVLLTGFDTGVSQVNAAIPDVISYQGLLTASGGIPASGNHDFRIKFYSASSGGVNFYEEEHNTISVNTGVFGLNLGTGVAVSGTFSTIDFNNPVYITLNVKQTSNPTFDGEMNPRILLRSVPYSLNSKSVNGQSVGSGPNNIVSNDNTSSVSIINNLTTGGIITAGTGLTPITTVTGTINSNALSLADNSLQITGTSLSVRNSPTGGLITTPTGLSLSTSCTANQGLRFIGSSWVCDSYNLTTLPGLIAPSQIQPSSFSGYVLTTQGGAVTWAPVAIATTASNGLTKVIDDIQLGGALTQNTVIDGGIGLYNLSFQNLKDFNLTGVGSVGTISNTALTLTGDTSLNLTSNGLIDATSTGLGTDTILKLDPNGVVTVGGQDGSASNLLTISPSSGLVYVNSARSRITQFTVLPNGDINGGAYRNTRDDSLSTAPNNFLYTDFSGNFLSSPISNFVNNWSLTGNAGTTPINNFVGTKDNQDLVFRTNDQQTGRISADGDTIVFGLGAGLGGSQVSAVSIGLNAGAGGAGYSIALGETAGQNTGNSAFSSFIGAAAGLNATNAGFSNFYGYFAGAGATNAGNSNFYGQGSGQNAANASQSNFFGSAAGANATNASQSNFYGVQAGQFATNANNAIFLGSNAGLRATNANNSIFLGQNAGSNDTVNNITAGFSSILIGDNTSTGGFSNSIALGAGAVNTATNQFTVGSAYTDFNFRGVNYTFPATQGGVGTTLTNNGSGLLSWTTSGGGATINTLTFTPGTSILTSNVNGVVATASLSSIISPITIQNGNSLFSTGLLNTGGGSVAINSNFFGELAGQGAVNANNSNFFGSVAGESAIDAFNSNFLGNNAGVNAASANNSNFLGKDAGANARNANSSNFLGQLSGDDALNANNSNFLGLAAGRSATNASNSNFFGLSAGQDATGADISNFIGLAAGQGATDARLSNFIGRAAGFEALNASISNFIGNGAGVNATNANNSTFIGTNAGRFAFNANDSIFLGRNSGNGDVVNNSLGGRSILIGADTNTGGFSDSIALGTNANNTRANQFLVGPSYTDLSFRGVNYTFPATQGGVGTTLTNNGSGLLSWATSGGGTPQDFFRSAVGQLQPDGTTDLTETVNRSGSLAIGTINAVPNSRIKLLVQGADGGTSDFAFNGRTGALISNTGTSSLIFENLSGPSTQRVFSIDNTTISGNGVLNFTSVADNGGFEQGNLLTLTRNGNIGINNTNPTSKLELSSGLSDTSGLKFTSLTSSSPAILGQNIGVDASGNVVAVPSSVGWQLGGNIGTNPLTNFVGTFDLQDLVFKTNSVESMRLSTTGTLSVLGTINTVAPGAPITIRPTARVTAGTGAIAIMQGGGAGPTGTGGLARLIGGNGGTTSGNGGNVNILGGQAVEGNGGSISFSPANGASLTGTARNGGNFTFQAGAPVFGGIAGRVGINGGPGNVSDGGRVEIFGGTATSGFTGGNTSLRSGGSIDGNAGNLVLGGAVGTGTTGNGGNVIIGGGSVASGGIIGATIFASAIQSDTVFTERMRLIPNGNFGIGTGSPARRLSVTDLLSNQPAVFTGTSASCDVDTGVGALVCTSDERFKNTIIPLDTTASLINQLRPVTYQWNTGDASRVSGFIAQEVEIVIPGLVSTNSDGFKSLNQTGLLPYLVKAFQEQQIEIEGIKVRLGITAQPAPDYTQILANILAVQTKNLEQDARLDLIEIQTAKIQALEQKNLEFEARLRALEAPITVIP